MKFLLLLAGWSTLFFIPSWFVQHPYQHVLTAIAGRLLAPPGSEIEFVDVELFYPFDLGIYLALCLASFWDPLRRRLRAIAIGLPVLFVLELISLLVGMKAIMSVMANPSATQTAADQAYRFATGLIRVTGLMAASGTWFFLLGRERLSLVARTWLDTNRGPGST